MSKSGTVCFMTAELSTTGTGSRVEATQISKFDAVRRATLGDQLRRHAQHDPRREAVVFFGPGGDREAMTYRELDIRATSLATYFETSGVTRGDRVAVMSRNCPQYIVAYYAALKLGAALTGINFTFTKTEIQYQLKHATPKVLIVEDAFVDKIAQVDETIMKSVTRVMIISSTGTSNADWQDFDAVLAEASVSSADWHVSEDDIAMLVYTSGTEAFPKGVMIPHRNYIASTTPAWSYALDIRMNDRWLFLMPFHTIAGLGSMTSLTQIGATVVLAHSIDAPAALRIISAERITIMAQTPTFYISMSLSEYFHKLDVSTLRRCITYGGTVPRSMIDSWSDVAPDLFWGTYWGQSELSQLGTVGWFKTLDDVPDGDPSWIGKPVPQLETRIVDSQGNDALEGELICRSPSVMLGYFKDAERTRATVKHGWLHTGDLVRTDSDGNLFFLDRKKDMIKTGGMNVSSVEVERLIYEFPGVQEVAVVGVPDPYWSEAVTAFVVLKPAARVETSAVIEFCKLRLAPFKVPKAIHLVSSLPKDTQGKILKRELRRSTRSGAEAGR